MSLVRVNGSVVGSLWHHMFTQVDPNVAFTMGLIVGFIVFFTVGFFVGISAAFIQDEIK